MNIDFVSLRFVFRWHNVEQFINAKCIKYDDEALFVLLTLSLQRKTILKNTKNQFVPQLNLIK